MHVFKLCVIIFKVIMLPLSEIRTEKLGRDIEIFVSGAHVFSSDALLLADFTRPAKKDKACDLGAGCGIIPFIRHRDFSPSENVGFEISENACALFRKSIEINKLGGVIQCINADIRELNKLPPGRFDLVSMNPPYKRQKAGLTGEDEERKSARHEISCTLDDAAKAANRLLKFGGKFAVCHRPERLCDLFFAMRQNGIEPKRLREVVQRKGAEPSLVLVEGKKGGNPGLRIDPVFYIEDENGGYTKEAEVIFCAYVIK